MSGSTCSIFASYISILLCFIVLIEGRTIDINRLKRFTKSDICHGTFATLEPVENCPRNETDIERRSRGKKCGTYSQCQEDPLVYHCVRYEDRLVEVCAPKGLITGNCCAVFNRGVGRVVEDYNKPCSECPFKYQSADSIRYNTCIEPMAKPQTHQTNIESTTPTGKSESCCNAKRGKRDATCCSKVNISRNVNKVTDVPITKADSGYHPASSEKEQNFPTAGTVTVIVLLLFACCLTLLTWRNWSRLRECSGKNIDRNTPTEEIGSNEENIAATKANPENAVNELNPVEVPLIESYRKDDKNAETTYVYKCISNTTLGDNPASAESHTLQKA